MEVFIRNIPPQSNNTQLKNLLRPHLQKLSIQSVDYVNKYNNNRAFLTFLHVEDAARFLQHHGQISRKPGERRSKAINPGLYQQLFFSGQPIYLEKAIHDPSPVVLRGLAAEEKQRKTGSQQRHQLKKVMELPVTFPTNSISCGIFAYEGSELVYIPQYEIVIGGNAKFGKRSLIVTLESGIRMDFVYPAVESIIYEIEPNPSFLISMHQNPRLYEKVVDPVQEMVRALHLLNLNTTMLPKPTTGTKRIRLAYLSPEHKAIAGQCLVYRIQVLPQTVVGRLAFYNQTSAMMSRLEGAHELPSMLQRRTRKVPPSMPYAKQFDELYAALASLNSRFPFELAFQIQKLAQNNYLPPLTILGLFDTITDILLRSGLAVAVRTLRKLFHEIPFPSPLIDSHVFELPALIDLLLTTEEKVLQYGSESSELIEETSKDRAVIHRARVMPMGMTLAGPEAESNNRILRKYAEHHNSFLRVQFSDEDGDQLHFNGKIITHRILHDRFKAILENGITIADRTFMYLGFSNSSLRMQSVWFVAPFIHMNSLLLDRDIIGSLGDFSTIRSPAKCAARIGQAFSDTRTAVTIPATSVQTVNDVMHGGYVFSDGVGTISASLLEKITNELPRARRVSPTCLQIRYRGAKGMVSLDDQLEGDVLRLRPSMVKFGGSNSDDLEICDATYKPLPVYLNRQFIKILEDMGVDSQWFVDLQNDEIERLRMITDSPVNASIFLRKLSVGEYFNFPDLVTGLDMLGLDFKEDIFLSNILEVAFLSEIRLLKHRTRIPVPKGWHLHGVLDETGLLEEGEIFCVVMIEGIRQVISADRLLITRAPALHPGDIQVVKGVAPPQDSPLMKLANCVCFSQKGSRDLPSQLGGGDLDGDRYYVIWDERAMPRQTFEPAEYPKPPPIDIGRVVTRSDMTDFFIKYMESDQLGRIAVGHRVLADQREEATLDKDCLTLAELHSDAVDFSKTGIPPDMSRLPRYRAWRPDFEAPGPHVEVIKLKGLSYQTVDYVDPNDIDEEADDDFPNYRYYESDRILGELYRAIDEKIILEEIQKRGQLARIGENRSVISALWYNVREACKLIQWEHLLSDARDIRDMYEDCLLNIMKEYSMHPRRPLSELEVFAGTILGRNGAQNRHQRELSITMKEKFDEDTQAVVDCIIKYGGERSTQSLEMSMACLAVSLEDVPSKRGYGKEQLQSFKYLAAAVCLDEMKRLYLPIMTGIPLLEG